MLCLLIWGIPVTATRLAFELTSDAGGICRASAATSPARGPTFALKPDALCLATGLAIERDARYQVEITLPSALKSDPAENEPYRPGRPTGAWMDRTIRVDTPAGFSSGRKPFAFYPVVPLRRVVMADWFVPIARVGSRGDEEHPLPSRTTEFTAQRSGELFLFVNDMVLPCPRWSCVYRNNTGGPASIKVTKLDARAVPTATAH
jgi:hypothetical protein